MVLVDGLVNLCKLADVNHRINRACDHDSQQVAHWIATERSRGEEYSASLLARQERLQFLRGEDEGRLIESSVGKLKEEINVLNQRLIEAAEEEEAARKVLLQFVIIFLLNVLVSVVLRILS